MKLLGHDRKFWATCLVVVEFAIILPLLCLCAGWFEPPWCRVGDSGALCFRDWLEALGGWAALLVGAPSLLLLWRQISQADKNQRIEFRISLRRSGALARRVNEQAGELKSIANACINVWDFKDPQHTPRMAPMAGYWDNTEYLLKVISHDDFERFENEFEVPVGMGQRRLIKVLETNLEQVSKRRDKEAELEEYPLMASNMLYVSRQIVAYADACIISASNHLEEIREIVEK